jgi:flagellar biosynthesis/type III secretory pathway protein FliH
MEVDWEAHFVQQGLETGRKRGEAIGMENGLKHGKEQAHDVGFELGFADGFAQAYAVLGKQKDPSALKAAANVREAVTQCKLDNEVPPESLDRVRARFKVLDSRASLGVVARDSAVVDLSF